MWTTDSKQSLFLNLNEVHIWHLNVRDHLDRLGDYEALLDKEEKEKAYRFRFQKDHNCSIIARAVLRILLGGYLQLPPVEIAFTYGACGKPEIDPDNNIKFNISHASGAIVLGFVQNDRIGVDVEFIDEKIDAMQIAKHFFSKEEIAALYSERDDDIIEAFYNCWTRKEAFIKAVGDGLSFPLDQFVVSLKPGLKAQLLETKWDQAEEKEWMLQSFNPEKNYVSAFAVKGKVSDIKCRKYL